VTAEVLQLHITKALPPQLQRLPAAQRSLGGRPTGGIDMLVFLRSDDWTILSAAEDAFQVATFIDDKENDLGRGRRDPQRGYYPPSWPPSVTDDGHGLLFHVSSDRAPAAASRVLLRGTVTLRTGSGLKTSERQELALRIGRKMEAGPVPFTIRQMSDSGNGVSVTFSTQSSIERIKQVRFFANDGQPIEARPSAERPL
jgi:hypothetical protein